MRVTGAVLAILATTIFSAQSARAEEKMMDKKMNPKVMMESNMTKMKDGSMMMSMDSMKWMEIPDSGGVMVSPAWGDMNKGAHGAFVKFPAGATHPVHTHSNDVKGVVLMGSFTYTPEGGEEMKMGPHTYFMIPGKVKHASGCAEGSECVLFQVGDKKFDMKPVDGKMKK